MDEEPQGAGITGVPLPILQANGSPSWHTLDIAPPDSLATADVAGLSLFVANVEGTLLAYRNSCASCNADLAQAELDGGALECPSCGRRYFLPQAGRSMDDEHLQLQPIPLLREAEAIKVAL
jgi:nitrite reductase/ring-hydroxylating ferredoxin subunit